MADYGKLKIVLKAEGVPFLKSDQDGFRLHVGKRAFEKNPCKVYEVPNTHFWRRETVLDNGRYILASEYEAKMKMDGQVEKAEKIEPKNTGKNKAEVKNNAKK